MVRKTVRFVLTRHDEVDRGITACFYDACTVNNEGPTSDPYQTWQEQKGGLKRIHMTHCNKFEDDEDIKVCQGDIDYQGIVKHINDGVVIIREGAVVFANNAFYEISQKKPDQVISSAFSNFISAFVNNEKAV